MFTRTIVFVLLIIRSAENSVLAFSIAQILSTTLHILFFYVYFYRLLKVPKNETADAGTNDLSSDFPFRQMSDFLPKYVQNEVFISLNSIFPLGKPYNLCTLLLSFIFAGANRLENAATDFQFLQTGHNDAITYRR